MGLARTFQTAADPAQKPARDALSALLALGRPLVMGILNVTPDSFSDGGRFIDPAKAIAQAAAMAEQGADILDIGAEFDATLWRRDAGLGRRGNGAA